jgi:hypothetical protein
MHWPETSVWVQLWPAVVVWLVITLPSLAWYGSRMRDSEWLDIGWWLRASIWCVGHTWPYSKLYRLGVAVALSDEQRRLLAMVRRDGTCYVCGAKVRPARLTHLIHRLDLAGPDPIEHALTHFPGEDDLWVDPWWTPPPGMTMEQAEAWLDSRAERPAP